MKKILPITTKGYTRTYTFHGFFHAVTNTEDKVVHDENETVAEIDVKDYDKWEWKTQNDQLRYIIENNNQLKFYTNRWNVGMNMAFWRDCQINDEIEIDIKKQINSNVWSSITLFLADESKEDMVHLESYDIALGHFAQDGVYYSTKTYIHNRIYNNENFPLKLHLTRKENEVWIELDDGTSYKDKLLIKKLEDNISYTRIGFAINLGDSLYYDWVFSNYIQLQNKLNADIPMDVMFNIHKNWNIYTANYLVDYYIETEENVLKSGDTLLEFIKRQVNLERYIEIGVNDYIHTKKEGTFFHQDLIYGFDDEKECLYLLYYNYGRIQKVTMTYQDFISDRNRTKNSRNLCMQKYHPCYEPFHLVPKHLLQIFKEYRDEINISYYEPRFEDDYHFGSGCLKSYCTPEGMPIILQDVRIIHLFCEHAVCNRDRILYYEAKGILSHDAVEQMLPIIQKEVQNLELVRSMVLRKLLGSTINETIVLTKLTEVIELDHEWVNMIIQQLENQ